MGHFCWISTHFFPSLLGFRKLGFLFYSQRFHFCRRGPARDSGGKFTKNALCASTNFEGQKHALLFSFLQLDSSASKRHGSLRRFLFARFFGLPGFCHSVVNGTQRSRKRTLIVLAPIGLWWILASVFNFGRKDGGVKGINIKE